MKKKTTVQSINKHSTPPSEETKIQKHEVPGLMTLSDSILSGAVVEYRKAGYSFARHLHTNIEIYRILSGECYMDIQSETIHCTEGEFIMLLPDVIHSFYLNDTSDCEFQHIHFNPEMFSTIVLEDEGVFPITLMHAILFSAQFYYRMESDPVINEHLQKLITLYASSNSLFSAANINVALMNLMLYILDHTETEREFPEPQLQNSYVAYTLNYVQEHFTQKIRQEDIALQLHISVRYLSKIFKNYMGVTLSNYINIYRINRSIELMQNTSLTLTEIALQVGFKDSQHYSKVFMNVVNATPSHYRKAILK